MLADHLLLNMCTFVSYLQASTVGDKVAGNQTKRNVRKIEHGGACDGASTDAA